MIDEQSTLKFRTPLLILMSTALLGSIAFQLRSISRLPQFWWFIEQQLANDATRYAGLYTLLRYILDPLLSMIPMILLLLYFLLGHRKSWGKQLVFAAYAVMALGYLLPAAERLVTVSQVSEIVALFAVCLRAFAFIYAALGAKQGMKSKLAMVAAPAIATAFGLYQLFFISIPQIPLMLEAGFSSTELILGYAHTLCSFCSFAALLLFGLTHTFPEPVIVEA